MSANLRAIDLFVSPLGQDRWSGRRPDPNADRTDGPFATLERAQKEIRKLPRQINWLAIRQVLMGKGYRHPIRKLQKISRLAQVGLSLKSPVNVWLREGRYFLEKSLVFKTKDSGNGPDCLVNYAAYRGEKVTLSGGKRITGWKEDALKGKKMWTAQLPEVQNRQWSFSQLFVNGARRLRTRVPREGFFHVQEVLDGAYEGTFSETVRKGAKRFIYREGDVREWKNLSDIEVVTPILWTESRMKFERVDPVGRIAVFDRQSHFRLTDGHKKEGARYFIENVWEALEEPGQWYLDQKEGCLYYLPRPEENLETAEVAAPCLGELVRIEGVDPFFPVQFISFSGISFEHTVWELSGDQSSAGQAAHAVGGAALLINAKDCGFLKCSFSHLGGTAIELRSGCEAIQILGNALYDLGGGGIKIWHGCHRNVVADNQIHEGGRRYFSAVGILIGASSENSIIHNEILNFHYSGISMGWTWGYSGSGACGNQIEFNHIHHLGSDLLVDFGGIYTVGMQSGSVIRHNVIHDIRGRSGDTGAGFLLDEGTGDLRIEKNLLVRTAAGAITCHYGKNIVISNNVFMGDGWLLLLARRQAHLTLIFERNIVQLKSRHALEWVHGVCSTGDALFRNNIYSCLPQQEPLFGPLDFVKWRSTGQDEGSLIQSPPLLNWESKDLFKNDFFSVDEALAAKIGFARFDWSKAGVCDEVREMHRSAGLRKG